MNTIKCVCGSVLVAEDCLKIRCSCGKEHAIKKDWLCSSCGKPKNPSDDCPFCNKTSWCIRCSRRYAGDSCGVCQETQEEVEDCLQICMMNKCGLYEKRQAKDRCCDLKHPCHLTRKLANGWRCRLGYHD